MDFFVSFLEGALPSIINVLLLVAVFVGGVLLVKFVIKLVEKSLTKTKVDNIQHKFITSSLRVVLYIVLVIVVLDSAGVQMQSIIAFSSVLGIAVSLAVQDVLSNIASGITILFTKPFEIGDYVQINGIEGSIVQINLTNTKLNTVDNKAIYIPNSEVSSNKLINFTREDTRRLDLVFSIAYSNDFRQAKQILLDTINKNPLTLQEPKEPLVRICEHGDSCIKIVAKVWVKSENYWDLNYDLLEDVKLSFDENGIEIPFNQLDVYLKK